MKARHVYILLDFTQVAVLRRLAQEALRNADEDLELLQKLHSSSARGWAQTTISANRNTYQELVDKAAEAREKLYGDDGDEYGDECDDDGDECDDDGE